jgi:hypothetical protein
MRALVALSMLLVGILAVSPARAASRAACLEACGADIGQCQSTCSGLATGRKLQKKCQRAILKRCRREGTGICTASAAQPPTTVTPTTITTTTTIPCSAAAPACKGSCPGGQVCSVTADGCACTTRFVTCAGSAPECDGECPAGLACEDLRGTCVCIAVLGFATTTSSTTQTLPTLPTTTTTTAPAGSCFNGLQDGVETDVDCGGTVCTGCNQGQSCVTDDDCAGNFSCVQGTCQ